MLLLSQERAKHTIAFKFAYKDKKRKKNSNKVTLANVDLYISTTWPWPPENCWCNHMGPWIQKFQRQGNLLLLPPLTPSLDVTQNGFPHEDKNRLHALWPSNHTPKVLYLIQFPPIVWVGNIKRTASSVHQDLYFGWQTQQHGQKQNQYQKKKRHYESIRTFSKSQNIINFSLGFKFSSFIIHVSICPKSKLKYSILCFTNFNFASLNDYKIKDMFWKTNEINIRDVGGQPPSGGCVH